MHLAFIDIAAAYTAETPDQQPLGGSQSAACYLAAALVKKGHRATLINQNRTPLTAHGIEHLPPEHLDNDETLAGFDAIIMNGRWTEKLVRGIAERAKAPLIGWMHEAVFDTHHVVPAKEFSAFVFVSPWQEKINAELMPKEAQGAVIPNGIAPEFHTLGGTSRSAPPVVLYAGSSKRGLLDLPTIIPAILGQHPALRFEIYSDCVVSRDEAECNNFKAELAALPHVDWVGAVSQKELPGRLAKATFFISPNTYPETFCIALAEAMAAGLKCIVTARAALPETASGYATLVTVDEPNATTWLRDGLDKEFFAKKTVGAIRSWQALPSSDQTAFREKQAKFAVAQYNWENHADLWVNLAGQLRKA
jgi:glycosyltransferase involved in cell wall biosynthesis